MFEVSSDYRWRFPDDDPDAEGSLLDEILRNWLFTAAIAWAGYEQEGRGTVVVDPQGCTRYRQGSVCVCHEELVAQ